MPRVLSNSDLFINHDNILGSETYRLSTGALVAPYLLGDGGYPNISTMQWLITVFSGHDTDLPSAKRRFNFAHSSARNVIERAFGRLKGRWRILLRKMRHKVEFVPSIFGAVLFCIIG